MHGSLRTIGPIVAAIALLAGVGLLVSGATEDDEALSSASEDDVVLRAPLEGDQGMLEPVPMVGPNQGPVNLGWNATTVHHPAGETRKLPTLMAWTSTEESGEEGIQRSWAAFGRLFSQLPGDPDGRVFTHTLHEVDEEGHVFHQDSQRNRFQAPEKCNRLLAPHLVQRTPAQAEQVLEDCLLDALQEDRELDNLTVETTSEWTEGERFDRVWVGNVTATTTNETGERIRYTLEVKTSPSASLVLEQTGNSYPVGEGDEPHVVRLSDWQAGDEPLDLDPEPLPKAPQIRTVDWSGSGPAEGQLSPFSIGEAKAAVEETDEGGAFFQAVEEPRLRWARFVEVQPTLADAVHPSGHGGPGCPPAGDRSPALPSQTDRLSWDLQWQSPEQGGLSGEVEDRRAGQEDPIGEPLPSERADARWYRDAEIRLVPPAVAPGPAPADLWEQRTLVDAFQSEGSFVLEAASDGLRGLEGELAPEEDGALVGRIGRVDCTTHRPAGDAVEVQETFVIFEDGQAVGVERIDEVQRRSFAPANPPTLARELADRMAASWPAIVAP